MNKEKVKISSCGYANLQVALVLNVWSKMFIQLKNLSWQETVLNSVGQCSHLTKPLMTFNIFHFWRKCSFTLLTLQKIIQSPNPLSITFSHLVIGTAEYGLETIKLSTSMRKNSQKLMILTSFYWLKLDLGSVCFQSRLLKEQWEESPYGRIQNISHPQR